MSWVTTPWLMNYYGAETDLYRPEVVFEGWKWAVVKLSRTDSDKGFTKVGYVLIRKDGSHVGGAQQSLHEGLASQADLDRMKAVLLNIEA